MRKIRLSHLVAIGAVALSIPGVARAQETGTPIFLAPYRAFVSNEVGGYLTSAASFSLEGFYSYGTGRSDIGLRGGFVNFDNDAGTQVLIGAHFRQRVIQNSQQFPLDGALTLGVGGGFGDGPDFVFIPVGLSLGRRFILQDSDVSFVPYVQPYLGLRFADSDTDVKGGLGLGVDIRFSKVFDVRVSGGVGDIEGVAIGLAFVR